MRSALELYNKTDGKYENRFFRREEPKNQLSNAASSALHNSKSALAVSLPIFTFAGLGIMFSSGGGVVGDLKLLGGVLACGGVIVDVAKAPFCLAFATEEIFRAGICKLTSLVVEGSPRDEQRDRILQGFMERIKDTAILLAELKLEDPQVLEEKLRSGDIEELVGLSLLLTAYASRHCPLGLELASGKILTRENCPAEGRSLFDTLVELKELINAALRLAHFERGLSTEERNLREAEIACEWISLIRKGQPLIQDDSPEAPPRAIKLVNQIIEVIESLKFKSTLLLKDKEEEIVSNFSMS